MTKSIATIDIKALQNNLQLIRQLTRSSVLAIVKSDAYGHGIKSIIDGLSNMEGFGVSCLEEALVLRELGVTKPILVMVGFLTEAELKQCAAAHLMVMVHQQEQIRLLQLTSLSQPITVWLKVDVGMHRLGFSAEDIPAKVNDLQQMTNVDDIVISSHLPTAYDAALSAETHQHLDLFHQVVKPLKLKGSLANSAGVLAWPEAHYDWVRPGIMLYGISPLEAHIGKDHGLKPVMRLSSKIIALQSVPKGCGVSYGQTWRSARDSRIAVVNMGYGDGYPRVVPSGTPVWVGGQRCPIVGRVCMEMMMVDVTDLPQVAIGDEVVLWGPELPVEIIAEAAGTIGYELLTRVRGRRISFEIV